MKIIDQEKWDSYVASNKSPYGLAAIRYAERWADLMELRMDAGASVADVAERASRDADDEGITGFMYGCAVAMLAKTWEHGEALRRWHNEDCQLGNESDMTKEPGGVINPALLSIK